MEAARETAVPFANHNADGSRDSGQNNHPPLPITVVR
jgi:hypothetical protein